MRALRGWKLPVLLFVFLLLVLGVYAAWQVWKVSSELSAAADDASALQRAVTNGDDAAADDAFSRLQDNASSAAGRTDGFVWSALTWAPVVGDDLEGVRTVSAVLDDLAQDGIDPLIATARDLDSLSPQDGQIPLEVVAGLREPVTNGHAAFVDARERLAEHDPASYNETIRAKYREIVSQVSRAEDVLGTAETALDIMPTMLGAEGPRNYLLVFQNNAEVRAGGGLPGAVAELSAEQGALSLRRVVASSSFGSLPDPVLPLTDAEDEIWNDQLGTFFLNGNLTPDFPRTADLWQARWEQEYDAIDGVMTIDPVTLSYVLRATGPLNVAGGPRLTYQNVVDELLHEVYLRFEDPADQDEYFTAVASAVFDRVSAGGEDPRALIEAFARGTVEGRVKLHSFDDTEQDALKGTQIAGELLADPESDQPQVGVYLNDATGAKMSYFLRHDVQVTANTCQNDTQRLTGRAYLLSDAPDDAASLPNYVTGGGQYGVEPGSQVIGMQVIGPVGGTISDFRFNGADIVTAPVVDLNGRPVISVFLELEPGFTADVEWRMTTGDNQRGDVAVATTPGIEPENKNRTAPSACS